MSPKATKKEAKVAPKSEKKAPAKAAKLSKAELKAAEKAALAAKAAAASEDGEEDDDLMPTIGGAATQSEPRVEEMVTSSTGNVSKNFRNHPDMENFYRFIHEHDLRIEALEIIDQILSGRNVPATVAPVKGKRGAAAEKSAH